MHKIKNSVTVTVLEAISDVFPSPRPSHAGPRVPGRPLQELPVCDAALRGAALQPPEAHQRTMVPQRGAGPHAAAGPQGRARVQVQAGAQQQRLVRVPRQQRRRHLGLHLRRLW